MSGNGKSIITLFLLHRVADTVPFGLNLKTLQIQLRCCFLVDTVIRSSPYVVCSIQYQKAITYPIAQHIHIALQTINLLHLFLHIARGLTQALPKNFLNFLLLSIVDGKR